MEFLKKHRKWGLLAVAAFMIYGLATEPVMSAQSTSRQDMEMESYVSSGREKFIQHTLGNAGVVSRITLPDTAVTTIIRPTGTDVFFAVTTGTASATTVTTSNATSGTTVASTLFTTGRKAFLNTPMELKLPPFDGTNSRTLVMAANANAAPVLVEVD